MKQKNIGGGGVRKTTKRDKRQGEGGKHRLMLEEEKDKKKGKRKTLNKPQRGEKSLMALTEGGLIGRLCRKKRACSIEKKKGRPAPGN